MPSVAQLRLGYDANGRVTRTTFADGTFTTHDYDALGNCISITDELGRTTRYVYDSRNRLIQTIFADGSSTRTAFDGAGHVVESTDELNHSTTFKYDKVGRLLETGQLQQFEGESNVAITTKNTYDTRGRLFTEEDANGVKTQIHLRRFGPSRRDARIEQGRNDPDHANFAAGVPVDDGIRRERKHSPNHGLRRASAATSNKCGWRWTQFDSKHS